MTHDGERVHLITFQREQTTTNDFGEIVGTEWVDVVQEWAKRTNTLQATAEAVASGAESYREQVRWDILARDVDPKWRIKHGATIYDIKSVGTSNDGSETAIVAVAGLSNG